MRAKPQKLNPLEQKGINQLETGRVYTGQLSEWKKVKTQTGKLFDAAIVNHAEGEFTFFKFTINSDFPPGWVGMVHFERCEVPVGKDGKNKDKVDMWAIEEEVRA